MVPDKNAIAEARFNNAGIKSKEIFEEETEYPWDIIGFDNDPLSNNRWSFCLHTDKIEIIFEADWPEIEFN